MPDSVSTHISFSLVVCVFDYRILCVVLDGVFTWSYKIKQNIFIYDLFYNHQAILRQVLLRTKNVMTNICFPYQTIFAFLLGHFFKHVARNPAGGIGHCTLFGYISQMRNDWSMNHHRHHYQHHQHSVIRFWVIFCAFI